MRGKDWENSQRIRALQNIEVREKMEEFAEKYEWQFWMTGTFRRDQAYKDTIKTKRAFYRFEDDLREKFRKYQIEHFMAVEKHADGDFTHVHGLLNGLEGLTDTKIWEVWFNKFGRARVEVYDPEKGAAHYLTKYLVKAVCDYDVKIDLRKSMTLDFKNENFQKEFKNKNGVLIRKRIVEI
jgi:hypothetical protein